jgi:hypothetical protein
MPAGTPAILTEGFRGFPRFLQANPGILHQLGLDRGLSNSSSVLVFDVLWSVIVK